MKSPIATPQIFWNPLGEEAASLSWLSLEQRRNLSHSYSLGGGAFGESADLGKEEGAQVSYCFLPPPEWYDDVQVSPRYLPWFPRSASVGKALGGWDTDVGACSSVTVSAESECRGDTGRTRPFRIEPEGIFISDTSEIYHFKKRIKVHILLNNEWTIGCI